MPRPTDIPSDGTCEEGHICLGLLAPGTTYTTSAFKPQITFSVPEAGWENLSDVGGVFQLLPIARPGDAIFFFRDPVATGVGAVGAGSSVEDLAAWLAANPLLDVTPAQPVTVGGLVGLMMDIRIAAGAESHPSDCPVQVCVGFFKGTDPSSRPTWEWDWGSAGPETQRLYLVTSAEGLVAIFVDSFDGTTFDSLSATADTILASVRFN